MLDPKIGLLENLPIFKGLSQKQLGLIVGIATKAFFNSGENLITRDNRGDSAFLIMTGSARCLHFPGAPSEERVGPGALLGELAMLVDTVHALTVQAAERVRALAIHREALRLAMMQEPDIAQKISDNLLMRLQSFAQDLRRLDGVLARAAAIQADDGKTNVTPQGVARRQADVLLLDTVDFEWRRKFG